ncbi:hypothetical protein ANASTE_00504 [Anaerofustis stercorihominis DSM 17244]|uniref:Cytidylate kinase n=1 Tax=Anaerofustis stercorihominis DSM 17244 TaxID=445971 RepID=B1C707_9FIRM|nr:cytidylate kinase-like family protein [Anaerofustis stercorihominis]EDS72794.1 hypothetical protein ANASTE_00504 [Anaerofustis stercorihominis DSM 17244]
MRSYVITIGREYGSGGRIIGKKLAEMLGISFYDEELINLMVKETGLASDFIKNVENRRPLSFFYDTSFSYENLPVEDQVSASESDIVRKVADNGPCVIVGLCADYVLRHKENCIRVFIHAPKEDRVKRVKEVYKVNEKNIEKYVHKTDKSRAVYYNYQTDRKWSRAQNYDLVINSNLGLDTAVKIIKDLVDIKESEYIG